jgi:hypothetical protein
MQTQKEIRELERRLCGRAEKLHGRERVRCGPVVERVTEDFLVNGPQRIRLHASGTPRDHR